MSALDPGLWEATDEEIRKMARIDLDTGDATEEMNKAIAAVARRRAVAELKIIAASICKGCETGECLAADSRETYYPPECCIARPIYDRIAAIEAEESTPPSASAQTAAP